MNTKFIFIIFFILTITVLSFFFDLSQDQLSLSEQFISPNSQYFFGTDHMGRNLFIRTLIGFRVSLFLGLSSGLFGLLFGLFFGILSKTLGSTFDVMCGVLIDLLLVLPSLIVVILISLVLGQGFFTIALGLGITGFSYQAKFIRTLVAQILVSPHIETARSIGVNRFRLIFYHILPLTIGPALVLMAIQIPSYLLTESFLSFLGLGIQNPQVSLGGLSRDGWNSFQQYPHIIFFPSFALFLLVLFLQSFCNYLQKHFNPIKT